MRSPGGYGVYISAYNNIEHDTFTCAHCNCIVVVKPMMDPADMGGSCKVCDSLICGVCVGKGCTPFEEKLKKWEARDVALRSYDVS